mmetsp:Transcript_25524/g.59813  ORF Transcript_25524/g.59813 Transcript_25524/m.59813 type:complete len:268 (-) Transcript_25524:195-998(-)
MSLHGTELFFVDQPEKPRFEFPDLARRGRHGHGFLSASEQDVVLRLADDGVVDGSVGRIRLEVLEVDRVVQLGGEVGGGGDEHRLLAIELQPVDLLFVRAEFVLDVTGLGIVQADQAVVEGHHQVLVQVGPPDVRHLNAPVVLLRDVDFEDRVDGLALVFSAVAAVEYRDLGVVLHEGIADGGEDRVVVGPSDTADRTPVGEGPDQLAGFAAPQLHRRVGARGQQVVGKPVGIQIPNGTLVTVEGADSLAVFDPPDAGNLILRRAEQ